MIIRRQKPGVELLDLLDRILDKGTTVCPSDRLRLAAADLRTMRAHIVVECIEPRTNLSTKSLSQPTRLRPVVGAK